ncbi:MAG: fibronectin type III domain-containing protein [Thermodesulfobacteriota bacterium]
MLSYLQVNRIILLAVFSAVTTFLLFSSVSFAASVSLAWDRPTDEAVKGYHIYYGLSGTDYKTTPVKTINFADETQSEIDNLDPGEDYVFAVTSHDGNGFESDFSQETYYTASGPTFYSIEANVLPAETGSIRSSSGIIDCRNNCTADFESGSSPMFTIEPDNAYRISDVKVNGTSAGVISSYTFENLSGPQKIEASFALKQYTVTATAGAGGAIDPSGELSVTHGDSTSFAIAASEGYEISDVLVNGSNVGPVAEYTFSNIVSDQSIAASFSKKSYTITASAGSGGAISPVGDTIVSHGDSASYAIAANDGYEIADVTVNGSSIGPVSSYTFSNVTTDGSINVAFAIVEPVSETASLSLAWDRPTDEAVKGYHIYYGLSGTDYKTTPAKTINFADETQAEIDNLDPGADYVFAITSHDGNGFESDFSQEIYYSASGSSFYSIEANVLPGETGSIRSSSGDIDCRDNCTADFESGSSPMFTIEPDNAYRISDVKVNGTSAGVISSYTFENLSGPQKIEASFALKQYTVTATAGAGGAIDPSGELSVTHGDSTSFAIAASEGYEISDVLVNGSNVGPVAEYTFSNIVSDQSIAASFSKKSYTITASAGSGGAISPVGDTIVSHGDSASYAIAANDGYEIADVTVNGSSIGPVSSYTFSNVTTDGSINVACAIIEELDDNHSELPPHPPVLLAPSDYAELASGESILLETDTYFHPEGSAHIQSRWQIRRMDQIKPFYDVASDMDLTAHDVEMTLESGLKYAWRVGFQDLESGLFAWSDERTFVVGEKTLQDQIPPLASSKGRSSYQMVSFGHWAANSSSEEVFGPLLEADYSSGDYDILAYDPNSDWKPNPSWNGGYREYGDFEVVPGKAYWVLAPDGLDLTQEGVSVSTASDIFVELEYNPSNDDGMNPIAVPNNAEYYWGDVEIVVYDENGDVFYGPMPIRNLPADNPYIDPRLFESKTRIDVQYEIPDSLNVIMTPYGGYWAKARAENVTLCFPYNMQVSLSKP